MCVLNRFSLTTAFRITRIKMADVCLVIHFNGFVFAEKGRALFVREMRILIKSTVLFGIDIILSNIDRIDTFELFDGLSFDAKEGESAKEMWFCGKD